MSVCNHKHCVLPHKYIYITHVAFHQHGPKASPSFREPGRLCEVQQQLIDKDIGSVTICALVGILTNHNGDMQFNM